MLLVQSQTWMLKSHKQVMNPLSLNAIANTLVAKRSFLSIIAPCKCQTVSKVAVKLLPFNVQNFIYAHFVALQC